MFISVPPKAPPTKPPTECSAAHPAIPPHIASAGPAIKNAPMIAPATAADIAEIAIAVAIVVVGFLKACWYPVSLDVAS